jgi:hypothetical protein
MKVTDSGKKKKLTNDEQLQLEYAAKESPKSMIQNIFQTSSQRERQVRGIYQTKQQW